ncbi:universal stress protein [Salipiger mucosus]|uniref:Universal stress protein UspA n=1 Tax=Salipiger mucosus DSM 16094 TaxID=1123237 RepID=S9QZD2_9RHOB|nr:universal stress protein [Salipiger mucosus]EPX84967.1 Universal stress protein UspA [Salipiger mucosus DSM 16094]
MFKKILAPYDGSQNAQRALAKAIEMSKLCGAPLTILTVYRHHSMLEASLSMVRKESPGNLDDAMRGYASEVAEHGKAICREHGLEEVRAFVKSGQTARTIVQFAEDHDFDVIIIGRRGLGSIEDYLMGSVSHKVTGMAPCPVLVT